MRLTRCPGRSRPYVLCHIVEELHSVDASDRGYDPFTFEVIKNRLASIADEMALTVTRTARSFIVKEALDFSTALFTDDEELIAPQLRTEPALAR